MRDGMGGWRQCTRGEAQCVSDSRHVLFFKNKSEKAGCKVLEAGDNKPADAHVTTNVEWLQVARHAIGSLLGCLDYSRVFPERLHFFLTPRASSE